MEEESSETDEKDRENPSIGPEPEQNGAYFKAFSETDGMSGHTEDGGSISINTGISLDKESESATETNGASNTGEEKGLPDKPTTPLEEESTTEGKPTPTEGIPSVSPRQETSISEPFSATQAQKRSLIVEAMARVFGPTNAAEESISAEDKSVAPGLTDAAEKESIPSEDMSMVSGSADAAEEQDGNPGKTPSTLSTETKTAREISDRTSLGFDLAQKLDEKTVDYQLVSTVEIKSVLPVQTTDVMLLDVQEDDEQEQCSKHFELNTADAKITAGPSPTRSYPDTGQEERKDDQCDKGENQSELSMGFTPSNLLDSEPPNMERQENREEEGDTEEDTINGSLQLEDLSDASPNTVQGLDVQGLEDPVEPSQDESGIREIEHTVPQAQYELGIQELEDTIVQLDTQELEHQVESTQEAPTPGAPQEVIPCSIEDALSPTLMTEDIHALPPDFTLDDDKEGGIFSTGIEFTDTQLNTGDPAGISLDTKMEGEEDNGLIEATENQAASVYLNEAEQMSIDSESLTRLQTSFGNSNMDIQNVEMEANDQDPENVQLQFSGEVQPNLSADFQTRTSEDVEDQGSTEIPPYRFEETQSQFPVYGYVTPNIYDEYERQRQEEENPYEELIFPDPSEREEIHTEVSDQSPSLYTRQEHQQSPSLNIGPGHQQKLEETPEDGQIVATQFPEERKQTSTLTYRLMQEQEDTPVYRQTGQSEYYTQSKPLLHRALKATDVSKSAERLFRDDPLVDESDDDVCYLGEKIVRIVDLTGDGDIETDENVFRADDIAKRVVPLDHAESLKQIELERTFAGTKARSEDVIGHQRLHKKESKMFRLLVALRLKKRAHSAAEQDQRGSILEVHQRQQEAKLSGPETPINEREQPGRRGEEPEVAAKPSRWRRVRERPAREQPEMIHNHRVSLHDRLIGCFCITA